MSPTIVVEDDRPVLILGGAGGPTIITAVLQMIVNVLDFNKHLEDAFSLPRFHHQYMPDVLMLEHRASYVTRFSQRLAGQTVVLRKKIGVVNAISWDTEKKAYVGLADPRGGGAAAAY